MTLVQIGSTGARMDATLTGRVQATVINPPASFIAQKRGMTVLADLPKMGLVYQHTSAATTRKYVREHPDIVRRYVKSQVEAVHRIYTDKEISVKTLSKYFGRGVEPEILEKTWANLLNDSVLPRKQYPSLEGIKMIMATEAKGKTGKPEDFVDLTFIRELDQSGYIDGLYKRSNREDMTMNGVRVVLIAILLCLTSSRAGAADKLVADYGGHAGFQSAMWVAKDLRIFDKYGLDVEVIMITGVHGPSPRSWETARISRLAPPPDRWRPPSGDRTSRSSRLLTISFPMPSL